MAAYDLSILVAQLRKAGYDARNLGGVGLTIWGANGRGIYVPAHEAARIADALARRAYDEIPVERTEAVAA